MRLESGFVYFDQTQIRRQISKQIPSNASSVGKSSRIIQNPNKCNAKEIKNN